MTVSAIITCKRNQAVLIPSNMRFPDSVTRVEVRAIGLARVIVPVGAVWDSFFVNGPTVSDDFTAERASQQQKERDRF